MDGGRLTSLNFVDMRFPPRRWQLGCFPWTETSKFSCECLQPRRQRKRLICHRKARAGGFTLPRMDAGQNKRSRSSLIVVSLVPETARRKQAISGCSQERFLVLERCAWSGRFRVWFAFLLLRLAEGCARLHKR